MTHYHKSPTSWRRSIGPPTQEHRKAPRSQTYKVARIAFDSRRAMTSCLVRNLSPTGACLGLHDPPGIPDRFNLVFDSGEPSRICSVISRKGNQVGVEFM